MNNRRFVVASLAFLVVGAIGVSRVAGVPFARGLATSVQQPCFLPQRPAELARPLTPRGLENIAAFARLVGVVRHFHPSDTVRTTNWDDFIICGVRAVEGATTPEDLGNRLAELFRGVAPDVRVMVTGRPDAPRPASPRPGQPRGIESWVHTGIVLDTAGSISGNVYSSALVVAPASGDGVPAGVLDPSLPWREALGAGVSASVPIARWVSLSSSAAAARRVVAPVPAREMASPGDRATRLAGVIIAWNVLQHSYPYFDRVAVDWPAELRRALSSAARDGSAGDYQRTLTRMIVPLRDGHGAVASLASTDTLGVLPVMFEWVERRLVVSHVDPAAEPLIRRGEVIRAVNAMSTESALRAEENLISGATAQRRRWRALQTLTLGPRGGVVTLDVAGLSDSGAVRTVRLTYGVTRTGPPETEKIAEPRPGILYVDLNRVTDADLAATMPRLQRASGLVFDMRGYPRGVNPRTLLARLTGETIRSAYFEAPVFMRPDRVEPRYRDGRWTIPPMAPRLPTNVVFLTGAGAVSAAESVMGIVEGHRLAPIVGSATAGTNGNVNPFTVPGGFRVVFTGMRVRKHDGTPHQGIGIQPTVAVERTLRGVAEGRDEILERGVEIVARRGGM